MFSATPTVLGFEKTSNLIHTPFWLDSPLRPSARPPIKGAHKADLVIVGAGFSGLWASLEARLRHPERTVVLIDSGRIAAGATGRNGGFMSSSLTHGFSNGYGRWPDDIVELEKLGVENLLEIQKRIAEFEIDCDFRLVGELDVAMEPYQVNDLLEVHQEITSLGLESVFLDSEQIQARVHSPQYLGARLDPHVAIVDPARLAWGLARAAESIGVVIHESSQVTDLLDEDSHVMVTTSHATVEAKNVILATGAFRPLLNRLTHYIVPVYDYVLVTQPLTQSQLDAIGWNGREGIGDTGNQFHYYRMTSDNRILFGGYDANYHRNNGMGPEFDVDHESFARLADHFETVFPQLGGVQFSHGWGGAIDTCSRFTAFWGKAHKGKTAYVAGYTGLGVGASRFGALTCLDLLSGEETMRTKLPMVTSRPIPFPPEPFRSAVIGLTKRSLQHADRNQGRRNIWLKTLDRLGLGFDS